MTEQEKKELFIDKWPEKYPHGRKAAIRAIRKASKSRIFDFEEGDEYIVIKKW